MTGECMNVDIPTPKKERARRVCNRAGNTKESALLFIITTRVKYLEQNADEKRQRCEVELPESNIWY